MGCSSGFLLQYKRYENGDCFMAERGGGTAYLPFWVYVRRKRSGNRGLFRRRRNTNAGRAALPGRSQAYFKVQLYLQALFFIFQ